MGRRADLDRSARSLVPPGDRVDTARSAHTSTGRQESVAEHTWRLCLMACVRCRDRSDIDLAKGLDKLETIMQYAQGRNPENFDYRFNLDHGRRHASTDEVLASLRETLDADTERRTREPENATSQSPR